MAEPKVYMIPHGEKVDGINVSKDWHRVLFRPSTIDNIRLNQDENKALVASYPRTGVYFVTLILDIM